MKTNTKRKPVRDEQGQSVHGSALNFANLLRKGCEEEIFKGSPAMARRAFELMAFLDAIKGGGL